jgi:saccharopine dehydrogenase (NAD+, L-lysine-forming)
VHTHAAITLLGRNGERARRVAAECIAHTGGTVEGGTADAANPAAFRGAIENADLVIVASSTMHETGAMAAAVLDAGADWLDINLSSPAKLAALRALEPRIEAAGRCFITDGGVHPGLPGVLVHFAAARGTLRSAAVAARFEVDWKSLRFSANTHREFLLELLDHDPSVFRDGRWRRGTRFSRRFDLGEPFGSSACVPLCMEEIRELPGALPTLRDVGFFIAGFGPFIDYAIMPLAFALASMSKKLVDPAAHLLASGLERFGSGERGVALVLEAEYDDGSRLRLHVRHPDAYVITAAPAVAAILQYLDGRRPVGLHTQAALVEPVRFLADLAGLGIAVSQT